MLSLKSHRWSELHHAYGRATDIPALLERLNELPTAEGEKEPWFTLWSALAHQGDVYSASFASVPHVVAALSIAPSQTDASYLHFPAWVEICRAKNEVEVPDDLKIAYFEALAHLPDLIAQAANRPWSDEYLACALSAIAVAKGHHAVAEAVLELSSREIAQEFIEWHFGSRE
jgi:hypothetical protein